MRGLAIPGVAAATAFAVLSACIVGASVVRADTCYETASVAIDCTAKSGAPQKATPKPSNTPSLREQLRERLGNAATVKAAPASADALNQRIVDARGRAEQALSEASSASDPERLKALKQDYAAAKADLDKAYDDAAVAAGSPDGRKAILDMKKQVDDRYAQEASQAAWNSDAAAAPPSEQPAPPAGPDNVTAIGDSVYVCDGPVAGANNVSCREVSRDGKQCLAVTLADGAMGWRDSTATPCTENDLAQRDAFQTAQRDSTWSGEFGADENRRAADLNAMSASCRAHFSTLLEGADLQDKEKAYAGYAGLRAECDAAIKKLAADANATLPERALNERLSGMMAKAMGGDPDALVAAVGERKYDDGGSYDPGEVLDFSIQLLNLFGNAASLYANTHGGGAATPGIVQGVSRPAGVSRTYGQGAPTRPPPVYRPSDISGTH